MQLHKPTLFFCVVSVLSGEVVQARYIAPISAAMQTVPTAPVASTLTAPSVARPAMGQQVVQAQSPVKTPLRTAMNNAPAQGVPMQSPQMQVQARPVAPAMQMQAAGVPGVPGAAQQAQQAAAAAAAAKMAAFQARLSGSVRFDAFGDSRQIVGLREDVSILFPAPASLDADGRDILGAPQFHMMGIKTSLKWEVQGPPVLGAKRSYAQIATDFTGPWGIDNVIENRPPLSLSVINGLYLTDAFFKLDWDCSSLLIGQHWHPFYDTRFSGGQLMIEPIARSPQIRFTGQWGCFEFLGAVIGQIDFKNDGPNFYTETLFERNFVNNIKTFNPDFIIPDRSTTYLRNSLVPNLHMQWRYLCDKHIFGIAFDVKVLRPRLFTSVVDKTLITPVITEAFNPSTGAADPRNGQPVIDPLTGAYAVTIPFAAVKTYKATERFASFSAMGFMGLQWDSWSLKLKGVYGESLSDQYMIGGYGVTCKDQATGREKYAPIASASFMGEIGYQRKKINVALVGGYSKNIGIRGSHKLVEIGVNNATATTLVPLSQTPRSNFSVFHFKPDMDYIAKIGLNAKFLQLPVVFAGGIEYCRTGFGTINKCGKVDLKPENCTEATSECSRLCRKNEVDNVRLAFSALYMF